MEKLRELLKNKKFMIIFSSFIALIGLIIIFRRNSSESQDNGENQINSLKIEQDNIKKDLKQSLNEQYRERHPNLPPSLTLSKIRNIKKHTVLFCLSINIEISTVAIAIINFERLCIKGLVTKMNRKLSMAVSLLLAYKFNETFSSTYHKTLELLLGFFDR